MKENKQKTSIGWKVLSGILAAALITVSCLYGFGVGTSNSKNVNGNTAAITATSQSNSGNNSANALSLWMLNFLILFLRQFHVFIIPILSGFLNIYFM